MRLLPLRPEAQRRNKECPGLSQQLQRSPMIGWDEEFSLSDGAKLDRPKHGQI